MQFDKVQSLVVVVMVEPEIERLANFLWTTQTHTQVAPAGSGMLRPRDTTHTHSHLSNVQVTDMSN